MAEFYSKEDEFDSLNIKEKKREIREETTPYSIKVLISIFKYTIKIVNFILFLITKTVKWVILTCIFVGVTVGAVIATDVIPTLNKYSNEAAFDIQTNPIKEIIQAEPSYIYDCNNNLIVKLSSGEENKTITYEELPKYVIDAMVSIEDRKFFSHYGIDLKGITRVMYNYAESNGEDKAGASTITQQLMRNYYVSREVTIERKIKEICYSIEYEEVFNKKQIFEQYINNIYFGNGYYGIETASYGYFNKSIKDCSLSEIAYLCALPNRPNYFNPYGNKYNAYQRRDKILNDMFELGYIGNIEYEKAKEEEINIIKREEDNYINKFDSSFSSYSVHCATEKLMERAGFTFEYSWETMEEYEEYKERYNDAYEIWTERLKSGGYKIYTSLDPNIQSEIQEALDGNLAELDNTKNDSGVYNLQGAITCIDNENNLVVGILSGRKQDDITSYYNRGYQAYRQPGSSIKPLIVYLPAICAGYNEKSILKNIDIQHFKDTGEQVGKEYTLENSVIWSRNGCAYYIMDLIGPKTGLSYLREMKFNRVVPEDYYLSSALGGFTYGVTTAEMASAYNCIYNNGEFREDNCIKEIYEGNNLIYNYKNENVKKVYNTESCITMIKIMEKVISEGTARSMKWDSEVCVAAGKTGTTNDNKDGWFCGITPYYSMSVWIGYDQPKTLDNLQGGTYPAEVWKDAMEKIVLSKKDTGEVAGWSELDVYNSTPEEYDGEEILPGREDSELLSDGYTVGDYRKDYIIEVEAGKLLDSMGDVRDEVKIEQIKGLINNIKGVTCKERVQNRLDEFLERTEMNDTDMINIDSSISDNVINIE